MSDSEAIGRGDILWVNCDPAVGVEPRKTRTCVVVSNDIANRFGAAVTVVPTQRYNAERASRAYMVDLRRPRSTLKEDRVANASMIMTYDRRRVVRRAGRLGADTRKALDRALAIHLGLTPP
ncbi:MAG: type II toxin-antitoxin system PemK/MazF family toxin [Deltaproteobacteria bacterium]|nr:type II toxin-antitoxin system PemK/MazF family toxin [Deltaproteobacteria bacterium]